MTQYALRINGNRYLADVEPSTPVLWVLRDILDLTGTKYGCGKGLCGACTILANGVAVRSCQLPVAGAEELEIQTIEGISEDGSHPVQQAWMEENVPQCGYCQGGQILSAISLLKSNPRPTESEIDVAMRGNACRCGTYPRIRKAIKRAAQLGVEVE